MKYIKAFNEELSLDLMPIEFTKSVTGDEVRYRFHCEDFDWYVLFTWSSKSEKWSRDYDVERKHYVAANVSSYGDFMEVKKNPLKIASAVTYITQKFIEEYSPECIYIIHINMKRETCSITSMNKRAKLNYAFLSKYIKGYTFSYYALTFRDSLESGGTTAVICKNGKEEKYLDWYDMSTHHKKIK